MELGSAHTSGGWERRDAPLGTLIYRAGLLSKEQVEEALGDAINRGKRLGQVLVERRLVEESDVARLLADQKGLPFVTVRQRPVDPEAVRLLPAEVAWLNHAVAVWFEDGKPVVAIDDPNDDVALGKVAAALGREGRFVVATRSELLRLLGEWYPAQQSGASPAPGSAPEFARDPAPGFAPAPQAQTPVEPPNGAPAPTYSAPAPTYSAPAPTYSAPAATDGSPAFPDGPPTQFPLAPDQVEADPVPARAPFEELPPAPAQQSEHFAPAAEAPPARPSAPAPDMEPAPVQRASEPAQEAPAAPDAASPFAPPAPAPTTRAHRLVLRLVDGETIEVAAFDSVDEAKREAMEIIRAIGREDEPEWPFVAGRFFRPQLIVSLDVVGE